MAAAVTKHGFRIVTGGTDNHLFLIEVHPAASPERTPKKPSTAPASP